jgi:hypothetical protein
MATSSVLPFHLPSCARRASTAARASAAPVAAAAATTAQSLEESFGRKGLRFVADPAGGAPAAELSVRNGSSLHLRLGDGLVTSYKPKVQWKDDGCREVLHTVGGKGGVGLVLGDQASGGQSSLLDGAEWAVRDADSDSYDAVQVHFFFLSLYIYILFPPPAKTKQKKKRETHYRVKINTIYMSSRLSSGAPWGSWTSRTW